METLTEVSGTTGAGKSTLCDLYAIVIKVVGTLWLTSVTWGASDALTAMFVASGYAAALLGGAILPKVRNPRERDSSQMEQR